MKDEYYWIKRTDAAKMLGVCTQTISNLAARGIIHEDRVGNFLRYPRKEVEALKNFPILNTIEQMEQSIDAMACDIAERHELMEEKYSEMRREFLLTFSLGPHRWDKYKAVIEALVDVIGSPVLTQRELGIIGDVLALKSIPEIADSYNLGYNRIRSIIFKALWHLRRYPAHVAAEKARLQNEITILSEQVDELKAKIVAMNNPDVPAEKVSDKNFVYQNCEPYTLKLKDLGLSVRALNCLRAADIETLGDLVSYKRLELFRFRNLGRKTIDELDTLLVHHNLSWDMWTDPERKYRYK